MNKIKPIDAMANAYYKNVKEIYDKMGVEKLYGSGTATQLPQYNIAFGPDEGSNPFRDSMHDAIEQHKQECGYRLRVMGFYVPESCLRVKEVGYENEKNIRLKMKLPLT